jgi:hypothetical protein
MSEINKKNVLICKQIFDINNEYELNIYAGNTLECNFEKVFNVIHFDIIVGNPPYNKDVSKNNAKGQVLWTSFVNFSFNILKNNGYLVFIHPPNWRKPKHELQNIFFNNQILHLKIMSDTSANKIFKCSIRVDYYVLQKTNIHKDTIICDELNNVVNFKINNDTIYIPNYGINIHNKLNNIKINKLICINPRSHDTTRKFVSKKEDDIHTFKLLNTVSSKGNTYYYSSKIHPAQNIKKVMFSNGRYVYPFYDDGILGGTQSSIYMEVKNKNEGNNLVNFINSKLFKFLIKTSKFNNFAISHEFISNIPNLSSVINNIDDDKIYKYLKLTKEEIDIIKK